MKRLWVQLSLASGGLVVGVMLMILIVGGLLATSSTFSYDGPAPESAEDEAVIDDGEDGDSAISDEQLLGLVATVMVSGFVGILSGIVLSRRLSAPISQLASAAYVIGRGDLNHRVEIRGSQEIMELGVAFNQMTADLQHAEVLRRNLMADVSHELRTPLTVLKGRLRAALDHIYELDEAEIAHLYEQTDHLIRLVNDLHELALAEAKQLPLHKTYTDMAQLLREVIQTFAPLAEEKQIIIRTEIDDRLPQLFIDASRIRQVLHNLLGNATQYTRVDGAITVVAKAVPNRVLISVEDTGIGIESGQILYIFDRFFRINDANLDQSSGGTGLGLAVAKAIVDSHDGHIIAHSEGHHRGSTFTIQLPTP